MNVDALLNNIANNTKKLVKRGITKPFVFMLSKEKNKHQIDIVGDIITILRLLLIIVITIIFAIKINSNDFANQYVQNIVNIFQISNNIYLAVFGVVLTAFSITTALWSNMAVKAISNRGNGGDFSIFEELLLSYVSILFWSIIIIVLNFVFIICLQSLPDDWKIGICLWGEQGADIVSTILIMIYCMIIFNILLYNIDLLYNMYTAVIVAAYFRVKEDERKENSDE